MNVRMNCLMAGVAMAVAGSQGLALEFSADGLFAVRLGTGAAAVSGTAPQAVFLDEFNATTGSLVRSIALPSTGAGAFTLGAKADNHDGHLNLSTDGQFLTLGGYRAGVGTIANDPGKDNLSSGIARVVGVVRADGSYDTSTTLGDAYNKTTLSAVASDGTHFWAGGSISTVEAAGTPNSGGIRYVEGLGAGASTSINQTVTQVGAGLKPDEVRNIRFVGSKLVIDTPAQGSFVNRGAYELKYQFPSQISPGTPQQAIPIIVNTEGSEYDEGGNPDYPEFETGGKIYPKTDSIFFDLNPAVPGYDVAYGTGGKNDFQKWSLVETSPGTFHWLRNTYGIFGAGSTSGLEINSLSGRVTGYTDEGTPIVEVFASLDQGIAKLTDEAGYNLTSSSLFPSLNATTGSGFFVFANNVAAGSQFRGLTLVPEPTTLAALGLVGLAGLRRRRGA